jgi:hypothetical protein
MYPLAIFAILYFLFKANVAVCAPELGLNQPGVAFQADRGKCTLPADAATVGFSSVKGRMDVAGKLVTEPLVVDADIAQPWHDYCAATVPYSPTAIAELVAKCGKARNKISPQLKALELILVFEMKTELPKKNSFMSAPAIQSMGYCIAGLTKKQTDRPLLVVLTDCKSDDGRLYLAQHHTGTPETLYVAHQCSFQAGLAVFAAIWHNKLVMHGGRLVDTKMVGKQVFPLPVVSAPAAPTPPPRSTTSNHSAGTRSGGGGSGLEGPGADFARGSGGDAGEAPPSSDSSGTENPPSNFGAGGPKPRSHALPISMADVARELVFSEEPAVTIAVDPGVPSNEDVDIHLIETFNALWLQPLLSFAMSASMDPVVDDNKAEVDQHVSPVADENLHATLFQVAATAVDAPLGSTSKMAIVPTSSNLQHGSSSGAWW